MRKIKKVTIGIMASIAVCASSISLMAMVEAQTNYAFTQTESIASDLQKGDIVTIPEGLFGDISAEHYVYCPNGDVLTADEVVLPTQGEYTIKYFAEIDGKMYVEERQFYASNPVGYFIGSGNNSMLTYETNMRTKRTGLTAGIDKGDTFYYNQVINMNETTAQMPAVRFTFAPQTLGSFDCQEVYFTFTDIYDANNKVEVKLVLGTGGEESHWRTFHARAQGQLWKAYSGYIRAYPVMKINTSNGTEVSLSANNKDGEGLLAQQYAQIWLDEETNKLYAGHYNFGTHLPEEHVIADLDDMSYQEQVWEGFTTGEVNLSITCASYIADRVNIQLLNAGDTDLSRDTVQEVSPTIALDLGEYTLDTLPEGVVGGRFPIFPAVATDKNSGGYIPLSTRVFYGYTRKTGIYDNANARFVREMDVTNGSFATPYEGYYAICYQAKGYAGNYVEYVVGVNVKSKTAINLDPLELQPGYKTQAQVYERVTLGDLLPVGGGVGELALERKIYFGNKEVEVKGNDLIGYSFIPQEIGTYTVKYVLSDMLGSTSECEYEINVVAQTSPTFTEDVQLPKYFFEATDYLLPDLKAFDANQNAYISSNITIIDGDGERMYSKGEYTSFKADENGEVIIRYQSNTSSVSYVVPIIKAKKIIDVTDDEGNLVQEEILALENYFVERKGIDIHVNETGIQMQTSGGGRVDFVRDLLEKSLSVQTILNGFGETFHTFVFTMTDSVDPTISVVVKAVCQEGRLSLILNDGQVLKKYEKVVEKDFKANFAYDAENQSIVFNNEVGLTILKTEAGFDFEGFPSGKVFIRFGIEDVISHTEIYLTKINSQFLNEMITADYINPEIYLNGNYSKIVNKKGDTVKLLSISTNDVLSPFIKQTVTVTTPTGEVAKATDGTLLRDIPATADMNYEFLCLDLGTYEILYTATDWNNRKARRAYAIQVLDDQAPTITVDELTEAKIGLVQLNVPTVKDDISSEIYTYTTVNSPNNKIIYAKDNRFTATEKGCYLVNIYAFDEVGNMTKYSYTLTIK